MPESYVLKHILGMFDDFSKDSLTPNHSLKELNSMKNTQPPENPTFILNQTQVKQKIKNKFIAANKEETFTQILLSGLVGDGKTHFINRIYAHFIENTRFYIIKFRVEDTERAEYNFIKMILSETFSKYYKDFKITFHNIVNSIPSGMNKEEALSCFREKLGISDTLSNLLYNMQTSIEFEGPALRVLSSINGKTELKKLEIEPLSTDDYLDVLKLFVANKIRDGLFIIMLDEFEHAHISLKPNAKKGFFQSYKNFIDKVVMENDKYKKMVLVTAITEQYEGELKNGLTAETALWSRLEPNLVKLKSFLLNEEELNSLLVELSYRYNLAYDYLIDELQFPQIIKALRSKFKESHPRSYRIIVSSILNIMDDIRYGSFNLENYALIEDNIKSKIEEEYDLFNLPILIPPEPAIDYKSLIEQVKLDWQGTSKKLKNSKLKTSIEIALKECGYIKFPIDHQSVSGLYFNDKHNHIFIGYGDSKRMVTEKFNQFLMYLDNLDEQERNNIAPYFIYPMENCSEGLELKFNNHPNVVTVGIELTILYSLLALRLVENEDLKPQIRSNLKVFYKYFENNVGGE
ncbi:hypothetical protein P9B03_18670 [Metasolibacillus meyeri]|uniref:KAP NTPase domain-containing protein n=1 Tax=Metasolibacillus meyeri TaxID=1071052 RepID=A0AAW9NVC4_9BACL|nr:hypothetical protein [Metasolibacillus meyeri]MEC1180492.1 hypothetical protein [Metasolibacillus meyeri]